MTFTPDESELQDDQFGSDESNLNESDPEQDEAKDIRRSARWYAVQVASGCEKRVKLNLEQRLGMLDVANRIFQIEIPQTPILKPTKAGKPKEIAEKVFPGYVLVRMVMDNETWQVVKNTPNVINFVGAEQRTRTGRSRGHVKPMPLGHAEVERIFKQAQEQRPVVKVDMAAGDKIMVLSGPFKDFEGEVIEVSPERSKLKALLSIFGRDTPVELEFNQIQKQS
ncbi:MAG: transcription termination/antitermination protein NusG [Leptolyngbya sp. DLM2.Bin15]|nr:MAG: transcription termination/antitermination protein NusG [Leptolyngbya sp. DLM2.Bin15]